MIVFVSPHFDDAIGSCGCFIHSLIDSGEKVQVLTVFAGEHDGTVSEFAKTLLDLWKLENGVTERNEENIEACKILGVNYFNLQFIEALYRKSPDWLYPFDGDLFGSIHNKDIDLPEKIVSEILRLYDNKTVFFFPAGRGSHVDHLIVKRAGEMIAMKGYQVWFYTDFSYFGTLNISLKIQEHLKCFEQNNFEKKVQAFNAYRSQLKMLFDSNDSREYFLQENKTQDGVIYEKYYKCL